MGESFEEAVKREAKEESGLSLGKLEVFKLLSGRKRIIEYPNGDVTPERNRLNIRQERTARKRLNK